MNADSEVGRHRPLAVVTGASTGIGYELAKCCANAGFDLIVAAQEPLIEMAAGELRHLGSEVEAVEVDLSSMEGVARLVSHVGDRPVDALLANAGRGLGGRFFDQKPEEIRYVIETNVQGTVQLVHALGKKMYERNHGRILITGSIAGVMPGGYHTVYNGTKALLDNFSYGLREELSGSAVTVTCLMPGPTETAFFERAHLEDTRVGVMKKDDPAAVAKSGFAAMMEGKPGVVTGWQNKLQALAARFTPATYVAKMHGKLAEPGSAHRSQ